MSRSSVLPILFLALLFLVPSVVARADEGAPADAPAGGEGGEAATPVPEPRTAEATKGPFTVILELTGSFEPRGAAEVAFRSKTYSGELEIEEAAGLGPVTEGQVLVRFKTEKVDRAIDSAEMDLSLARTNLQKQKEEFARQGEATEIALLQARTAYERAKQNLDLFREVQMPMRKEQADHNLRGSEFFLQDQIEELEQLEKMYKADDLTEETEEIVLRRTRRNLERQKKGLEFQRTNHRIAMEVDLPRDLEGVELALRKETNQWERVEATARLGLEAARIELEKAKTNFARQEENLGRLKADRDQFVLTAPIAGIAIPGTFARGKWTSLDESGRALKAGQNAKPEQVLFTVIVPGALGVRTSVGEADLLKMRAGQSATASPVAAPDRSFPAKVARVMPVSTDGNYEVLLDLDGADERLMPGQGVKVKVTVDDRPDALTVPAAAVYKDDGKSWVQVWADGKASPREVTTGPTSDGRTEICSGLEPGEKVLAKPEKGEKK
jgi:RND family efflux transporter MFP subunit